MAMERARSNLLLCSEGWGGSEMTKKLMVLIALAAVGAIGSAAAQSFPTRHVTLVVPLATGGSTDTIGRIVAEGMRAHLGQPVIVENSPGAGGTTGVIRVARSAPDGYTLQIGQWGTNVASGAVHNLPIDLLQDLQPVVLLCTQPFMIVGKKGLAADNLKELIAWLKDNSGKVSVGTAGPGSPSHVAGVFFQNAIGGNFQFIPYRSAGLSTQDLVAGQIDMIMDTPATSGPHVRNGLIKAYAITANKRSPAMPDVPTVDEAGLSGFLFRFLARDLGAQGHAEGCDCQAQRRGDQGARRSGDAQAADRHRAGALPAGDVDAGGARPIPEGRDRKMVAGDQGCRHQGAMTPVSKGSDT